jgi:hypothetical protein
MWVAGIDGCRGGLVSFKVDLASLRASVELIDLPLILENKPDAHAIPARPCNLVPRPRVLARSTRGRRLGQPCGVQVSEMALMLARALINQGRYDAEETRKAYMFWMSSGPFDCGGTVSRGLQGRPNHESQARVTTSRC